MAHPEEVYSENGTFDSKRIPQKKNKKSFYELSKKKLAEHFTTQYGRDGEELSPEKIGRDSKKQFFSPRSAEIHKQFRRISDYITKQHDETKKMEDKILRNGPKLRRLNHKVDPLHTINPL